jgi:hypothetical protein
MAVDAANDVNKARLVFNVATSTFAKMSRRQIEHKESTGDDMLSVSEQHAEKARRLMGEHIWCHSSMVPILLSPSSQLS